MHDETQPKTKLPFYVAPKIAFIYGLLTITSCSFVELNPGAKYIIFSNSQESCQKISAITTDVKTDTFWIDRTPKAIADELQILAQNVAYKLHANAIWPSSEVENGQQTFDILRCDHL